MKLLSFGIENYKGIEDVTIALSPSAKTNVYCFVGLNESGKTTLLEALSSFQGWTETLAPVTSDKMPKKELDSYIPKSRISNFTGSITIRIKCALEPEDKEFAIKVARDNGILITTIGGTLVLNQSYRYEDSVYVEQHNTFNLDIKGRLVDSPEHPETLVDIPIRQAILKEIKSRLPAVLYFPNALFDTPDQIQLDSDGEVSEKDQYYQQVLQDALDSLSLPDPLNLKAHITDRIGVAAQEEALDNTVRKLETIISDIVFKAWRSILGKDLTGKKITLRPTMDGDGTPFLQIRYSDGADSYKVSERSLGFRWFFGFLLLTEFRRRRHEDKRQVIYVFDEPASNLHSSAQKKLLEAFGHLAKESPVLYSTHSHHLINPDWLENAFVVSNIGLTYDPTDSEYSSLAPSTKINVERYRTFVAGHKNQTTYYQPILDVLDYQPSHLDMVPNAILVEGKNDYYSLRFCLGQTCIFRKIPNIPIIPGNGAGGLDPIIKLYAGWGASFQILLDSDRAGKREKARYEKAFGLLVTGRINLLSDIVAGFLGPMENMFINPA